MIAKSFRTQDDQVQAVALAVADLIEKSNKQTFNLVVTGGGLGIKTLEALGKAIKQPKKLRIIFCDERFVDYHSPDRNESQAISAWPTIEATDFIRYPQPNGSIESAASEFSNYLDQLYGDPLRNEAIFDLILLGIGEDGHVASLFPGKSHSPAWVVAELNSPKSPKERLSLSYEALNRSEQVWFVVGGASKVDAMKRIRNGEQLPATKVVGIKETIWWLDDELNDAL